MAASITLNFYKQSRYFSYQEAKKADAVQSIELSYGEAHLGLEQTAVYDAMELINAAAKCFNAGEPLAFVLTQGDKIIDCGCG